MNPTVSVILPCFNRRHSVLAAINSVLDQSYRDLELIVVDDGSTDDLHTVIETIADPRLVYHRRDVNEGAAAARNAGIALARGQFIAFQDSDDIWLPGKLERQVSLLESMPDEVGVVSSFRIIAGRDDALSFGPDKVSIAPILTKWPRGADQVEAMLIANRLSLPCSLFRRNLIPSPAWFDTCAKGNEDWEFAVRISQVTVIHEDHRPVMLSFVSGDSISSSRRKQSLGTLRLLKANRWMLDRYPQRKAEILLDVARALAATQKPKLARRYLLESLRTHPHGVTLVAQSMGRRMARSATRPPTPRATKRSAPVKQLVTRLALFGQRHSGLAPASVRNAGRTLLSQFMPLAPAVESWERQLVRPYPLGEPPAPVAQAAPKLPFRKVVGGGEPVRCLIVTGVLDVGGTDEVAAFLARRLPEHGFDTMIAHTGSTISGASRGGRLPTLLRQEGVRVEEVEDPLAAVRLVEEFRPTVISAHCPPLWWLDIAVDAGVPFVETLHGMHDLYDTDWAEEARRAARKKRLIAVSELVRQQYLQGNPQFDSDRIVTIPNSVDPNRVPPVDGQAARKWLGLTNEFLFVSLARHALQKNGYALIEAFGDVAARHPEAHLLLAGRPDNPAYMNQLLRLRDRLPCRDRIHLRDHAPWPWALLAAADAFVMDSFFEGWSLATMEALCAGLPVITSDVGGAREQIADDPRRGVVVPNPLGNPLAADWHTVGASLYLNQVNRADLSAAMANAITNRAASLEHRSWLRAESLARFHPDLALQGHATVLREVAAFSPISHKHLEFS